MRVSVKYSSYNQRRYGRPWIGKITSWPIGGKAEIAWGSYLGNDTGGECEIEVNIGDIVRSGQRDNRGNNTENDWYVVEDGGHLRGIDPKEARELYEKVLTAATAPTIDLSGIADDALIEECKRRGIKL